VEEQIGMVQELAQENGATSFRFASDAEERNALWRARHNAW
jgi:D-lactate dehydrogenase (cytochrome)